MTGDERRIVVGLWGTPGVGRYTIAEIRKTYPDLSVLADAHPAKWLSSVLLAAPAREGLLAIAAPTLGAHADEILQRVIAGGMSIVFEEDDGYPRGLGEIYNAPPLLFYRGRADRPNGRRRLAIVGSRNFEPNFIAAAETFCAGVAARLTIVSGGARGIDQIGHNAAIAIKGETWAFMGSALDELDSSQASLAPRIVGSGGTVFSEFPPGVRADKQTFVRRNRLISGSSDAVLLMRGNGNSGGLITVQYACEQGRLVLAVPGQIDHQTAVACNALIRAGVARAVCCADDVFVDMGLEGTKTPEPAVDAPPVDLSALSANAQAAFQILERVPADFDSLLFKAQPLESGPLASALVELELAGLLVQRPGRRYERR